MKTSMSKKLQYWQQVIDLIGRNSIWDCTSQSREYINMNSSREVTTALLAKIGKRSCSVTQA